MGLQEGEFVGGEFLGYLYCSHGQPRIEDSYFHADVDILYMFDAESGDLALTSLEWATPSPPEEPTATPRPMPTIDPDAVPVCIDGDRPLVETGRDEPRELLIRDIIGGNCAVDMTSQFCFAGGEVVEVAAPDACSFQFGGGEGMCWICGEVEVEAEPLPSAVPAEGVARDPECAEYVTEQEIGAEERARYGIAEKLAENKLQRHWSEGSHVLVCNGHQAVDKAVVGGTELYYMFDVESGVLLKKRIRWRHDLPEHLPPLAISQEEAESIFMCG